VIAAIDDGHVDRPAGKPLGRLKAAETCTDNHHARASGHQSAKRSSAAGPQART